MNSLKFYKGKRKNYRKDIHGEGLYFSTDTFEIIYSGNSYAYYPSKEFMKGMLSGSMKDLGVNEDGKLFYRKVNPDLTTTDVIIENFPKAIPLASYTLDEEGNYSSGQDGLMSSEDKYKLDQVDNCLTWQVFNNN